MPKLHTKSLEATIARRLASRRSNLLLKIGLLFRIAFTIRWRETRVVRVKRLLKFADP